MAAPAVLDREPQQISEAEWLRRAETMLERVNHTDVRSLSPEAQFDFAADLGRLLQDGEKLARSSWRVKLYGAPFFLRLGVLNGMLGRWEEADRCTREAESIAAKVADHLDATNAPDANLFRGALENVRQKQVPFVEARALFQAGEEMAGGGAWYDGLEKLREALNRFEITNDGHGKVAASIAVGNIHQKKGDYEVARMFFGDAARHARKARDRSAEATAYLHLGAVEIQLQWLDQARLHLGTAHRMFSELRDEQRRELTEEYLGLLEMVERVPEAII